jgi:hypothetical protein
VAVGAGTLKVTKPNDGEDWTTDSKYTLKWRKGDAGTKVKIELLRAGKVYKTVKERTSNDGRYRWKVPSSVTTSNKYKIRVTSITDGDISDTSNKNFTITKKASSGKKFKVTSPNGGESWYQGTSYSITWDTGDVAGDAIIELRTGSGTSGTTALTIAAETKNDGSYIWKIPTTLDTGSNFQIRIRSIKDKGQVDTSDKVLSIKETTSLTLTSIAFKNGGHIPKKYTCDGSEASPPLTISGVPGDAKELVLFLDDLDGTPSVTNTTTDWNHWVVTNIPTNRNFRAYRIPAGAVEGRNDEGDSNYLPICPPGSKGNRTKHNYQFTLYVLDKKLTNNSSTRSQIVTAMDGAILLKRTLRGYFGSD